MYTDGDCRGGPWNYQHAPNRQGKQLYHKHKYQAGGTSLMGKQVIVADINRRLTMGKIATGTNVTGAARDG